MKRICDMFGVVINIVNNLPEDVEAQAYMNLNMIAVCDDPKTRDSMVSTVMHEICHILAARQGKYYSYHCIPPEEMTAKDVINFKRIAVNAEIYVDTWAERLTKMYFPSVVYEQCYRTPESREEKRIITNQWAIDFMQWLEASSSRAISNKPKPKRKRQRS